MHILTLASLKSVYWLKLSRFQRNDLSNSFSFKRCPASLVLPIVTNSVRKFIVVSPNHGSTPITITPSLYIIRFDFFHYLYYLFMSNMSEMVRTSFIYIQYLAGEAFFKAVINSVKNDIDLFCFIL